MRLKLFMKKHNSQKIATRDIALVGIMVAIIEVCKVAIAWLPNIELTSFLVVLFTIYYGKKMLYVIPAFIFIEGLIYGFGLWWVMYLYAWPILALVAWRFRKVDSAWTWSIISGVFGLVFGALCAIPYLLAGGPYAAFTWWIAGIPWDMVHGISNFAIMLVLYRPMKSVMVKVENITRNE